MKHPPSTLKPLMVAIVAALAAAAPGLSAAAGPDPRIPAVTYGGTVPTAGMNAGVPSGAGAGTTPAPGTTTGTTPTTGTTTGTTPTTGTTTGTPPTTVTATGTTLSAGQMRVAGRVAAPFATLAGSSDNALALATALRTGTPATLSTTSTDTSGTTVVTTTWITPPTKPMGWGNVSHSLALAQFALSDAGVANPTASDLQAALLGGTVTGKDGATVTLAGVLQQRADGMGWGTIAKSYGTTMGAVNHTLHAAAKKPVTSTAAGMPASTTTTATTGKSGIVTAEGGAVSGSSRGVRTGTAHGAKGVTTAAGTTTRGPGVTTAAGATSGGASGIVSAAGGNGNAFGRGIVTASGDNANVGNGALNRSGGGHGVVTAAGGGTAGVASAKGTSGNGNANGQGKGKAGG